MPRNFESFQTNQTEVAPPDSDYPVEWTFEDEESLDELLEGETPDDRAQRASQLIVLPAELNVTRDRGTMVIDPQPDFGDDISTIVQDEDIADAHSMGGMTPAPSNPSTPERQRSLLTVAANPAPLLMVHQQQQLQQPLALPNLPPNTPRNDQSLTETKIHARTKLQDDTSVTLPETPEKEDGLLLDNYAEHAGLVRWTIHPDQDSFVDNKTAVTMMSTTMTANSQARRRGRRWKCLFLSIGICSSLCLLAGIAILSLSLYQVRRQENWKWNHLISFFDNASSNTDPDDSSQSALPNVPEENSSWIELNTTTLHPTTLSTSTRMPTLLPTTQPPVPIQPEETPVIPSPSMTSSPTALLSGNQTLSPSTVPSNATTQEYQQFILQTVDHLAHFTNLSQQFQDSDSVQYQVLEWIRTTHRPPQPIESWKLVQRFALGIFSVQTLGMSLNTSWITNPATRGRWMSPQDDECDWPMNTNRRGEFLPVCNPQGRVVQLVWHDATFRNVFVTLPPEIAMLTSMQILELQRHNLQGDLPTQMGLLTNLRRLTLSNNNLQSTIPTELGKLTKLTRIHLDDNSLRGTLPTELSNLWESLQQIHWQNNHLTGIIPQEWMVLGQLDRLKLSSNLLQGSIPASLLMDLPRLRELTLQENDLTGSIPLQVCNRLVKAKVDCEMVACSCCENCGTSSPSDWATATTGSQTLSPTTLSIPSSRPETTPPTEDDNECSEDWIGSGRACYLQDEAIDFTVRNCQPRLDEDRVALYRLADLSSSGLRNDFFWMPTCGKTKCESIIFESRLYDDASTAGTDTFQELTRTPWPLESTQYALLLIQILNPGSVRILAASDPFQVVVDLQDCDP